MTVSAINYTKFTYNPVFGNDNHVKNEETDTSQFRHFTTNFTPHFTTKELKEPIVVAGTVAGAGLLSYLSAQCILAGVLARFAPKLSVKFEATLRNNANKLSEISENWANIKPEGKWQKIQQITGKVLAKTEKAARSIYKNVAYIGLPETMNGAERTYNSFGNIAGAVVASGTIYNLCTKDEDNDGIKDIMQRKK